MAAKKKNWAQKLGDKVKKHFAEKKAREARSAEIIAKREAKKKAKAPAKAAPKEKPNNDTNRTKQVEGGLRKSGMTEAEIKRLKGKK